MFFSVDTVELGRMETVFSIDTAPLLPPQQFKKRKHTMATVKDHERGTPRGPLSRSTSLSILILSIVGCAAFSTWLVSSSLSSMTLSKAALVATVGSSSSLVGIIRGASSYAMALSVAVFIGVVATMDSDEVVEGIVSEAAALAPLTFTATLSFVIPSVFSMLADVTPLWGVVALLALPIVSISFGYVQYTASESSDIALPAEALVVLGLGHVALMAAWYINRPSKLCNLSRSATESGVAVATGLAFLRTVQSKGDDEGMLLFVLGSLTMTMLYVYLGAVADAWYTVGTGQFWMVSLDGSSLIIYLLAPILILVIRGNEKYGETIHAAMVKLCKSVADPALMADAPVEPTEMLSQAIVLLLALGSVVGIRLIKSLCPIGGHLFGRVYTHGQQSTRKVALVLSWQYNSLVAEFAKKSIFVNLLVTASDLESDGEAIKSAVALGHDTIIGGDVAAGYKAHRQTQKMAPGWCQTQNLSEIIKASEWDMKIGLWSSILDSKTTNLAALVEDVEESLGGSIVYVQDDAGLSIVTDFVTQVVAKGYSFASLGQVAKEDPPMTLTTS